MVKNNPLSSCCRITHILLRTQDRWGLHTDRAGVTSVCVLFGGRVRVKSDLPVCQSLPCCRGVGGSVRGSAPAAGRSGRSRVWAAIRRSPTSCPCCYFSRGVGWKGCGGGGHRYSGHELTASTHKNVRGKQKSDVLHFELLTVALGQHTCVGEWEPATPGRKNNKKKVRKRLMFHICRIGVRDKYLAGVLEWLRATRS